MSKFATVYGLLYGNEWKLHKRFLESLFNHAPRGGVDIRLWCNTVGTQTKQYLHQQQRKRIDKMFPDSTLDYYLCDDNRPKYKAMREMFHLRWKPESDWVVWFDDDSYINKGDWWNKTVAHLKDNPTIAYMGEQWYVHHLPGQWDFITKASWYNGCTPEMCPTRRKGKKKPGVTFAQGAYWWLRTDLMKELDWPDPRLNHNGGDTLLGEAARQQGIRVNKFSYGVLVNKHKRRGFHEKPAGSKRDVRR